MEEQKESSVKENNKYSTTDINTRLDIQININKINCKI